MNTLLVGAMASPMDSISTINEDEVFNVRNDRNTRNSRNTRNTITIPPLLKPAPTRSRAETKAVPDVVHESMTQGQQSDPVPRSSALRGPVGGKSCSIDTKAPKHYLVWGGILIALYTSLGKFAYKYVNYATGTVLKSAKLIPVMFVSVIWLKRRYAFIDYVACVLLVAAACEFGFAEQEGQEETKNESENYALGVTLSVITIAIGAVQSNVTDRILRDYGASVAENMLWTNAVGAVFVFFLVVTIEPHAFMFFWQTPFYFMLLTFRSVSFFFGAWLYTIIVKYFGAVPAVAITTTRKLLTVIGSFIFFSSDKPFSTTYAIALALFIAAVACEFVKHVQKHGNPCSFRKASPLPK